MLPVQSLPGGALGHWSGKSLIDGKAQESNKEELLFQRLLAESLDVPPHLGHSDGREVDQRGTPGLGGSCV